MANKQNFKPDEWTKILESTMLAGMAVSAAEPSGLWGALKEAFASSSALAAAKSNAGSNELIKAVVAEFETKEGRAAVQEALRSTSPGPLSPLTQFTFAREFERRVWYPQCQGTPRRTPGSRPGYRLSARTWLRPLRRAVFSASEECRSAMLRRPLSRRYQRL